MDKKEILEKSRAENQNKDLYAQEVSKTANSAAVLVMVIIAAVFFLLQLRRRHALHGPHPQPLPGQGAGCVDGGEDRLPGLPPRRGGESPLRRRRRPTPETRPPPRPALREAARHLRCQGGFSYKTHAGRLYGRVPLGLKIAQCLPYYTR